MKWVTRERPKTDRIACPWLIRRFVDPEAEILYEPAGRVLEVAAGRGPVRRDRLAGRSGVTRDGRRILAAQAVRALGYGMTSVLLGASLQARGWSGPRVGVLLAAILAGTALLSVVVGRRANR